MFPVKFIYDLTSRPVPREGDLEQEVDRLLYLKTAEEPNFVEGRTPSSSASRYPELDVEVVSQWIQRKFEPALLLILLGPDNYYISKAELTKMDRYQNLVDKLFRSVFLERHAKRRVRGLCFDDLEKVNASRAAVELKRTLTFLAEHLDKTQNSTLFGTDAYTQADIGLYSYLKRISVGRYSDSGLKSHLRHCEALIKFMQRYAKKNAHVIDITSGDPSEEDSEETSLVADITKPAAVVAAAIMLYLWLHN